MVVYSAESRGKNIREVEPKAMAMLKNYEYPGNIRELENVIERAVLLSKGRWVSPEDLPSHITAHNPSDHAFPTDQLVEDSLSIRKASKWMEKDLIKKALERTGGNRTQAAKILEISRPTLDAKIKEYQLKQK